MVWAIEFPSDYNEFFPQGDFKGYDEAMAAHYQAEIRPSKISRTGSAFIFTKEAPLDGDGKPYEVFSSYALDVSEKFHAPIGEPRPHRARLLPVQPHEWPQEYVYERVYKRRASIVKLPNRMFAVEDDLRNLIEALEPGIHSFNPIRMTLPKGVEHPIQHHMMIVGRWLHSFRMDLSDESFLRKSIEGSASFRAPPTGKVAHVAMDSAVIGDAHIWCERRLRGLRYYISDTLHSEAAKLGLRLPKQFKLMAL